jgi:hypothetical protein
VLEQIISRHLKRAWAAIHALLKPDQGAIQSQYGKIKGRRPRH